jgi:hypothetical protein
MEASKSADVNWRDYDAIDLGRVECAPNPFGAKLLPMSPE